MTKRATVVDFPIGCTVKIIGGWDVELIGRSGTVAEPIDGAIGAYAAHLGYVPVTLDGSLGGTYMLQPEELERGRVEWIKDEVSE